MRTVKLGKTNIDISTIGLGCWQFSKPNGFTGMFWGGMDEKRVNEVVKISLEQGINWFDTAEIYGRGTSEEALSQALRENEVKPGNVVIATKWSPVMRFSGSIKRTFHHRVESLSPFSIDLHQIHNPASFSSVDSQMKAMSILQKEGKIRSIGVSNFSASIMQKAQLALSKEGLFLASNQMQYNLLDRRIEKNGVLDYAKKQRITIIAYSPLAQGILSGKYHENPDLIKTQSGFRRFLPNFRVQYLQKTLPLIELLGKIASGHKVTAAQIALRWLIQAHV